MRKLADDYEDEYQEDYQEEAHDENYEDIAPDDDLADIYGSSNSSGGGSTFKYLIFFAVVGLAVWQYFKINTLNMELRRTSSEKYGTEQTLTEQKSKFNTREQTILQLEGQVSVLEKKLNDAKKSLADAEGRVGSNSGEVSSLKAKIAEVQAEADKYKAQADMASKGGDFDAVFKAEDLRVMTFKGGKNRPGGSAKLLWSQKLGVIYVNIFNLEKNPDGKDYQLWGNEGDKFFSVGTFSVDASKKGIVKIAPPSDLGSKKISDFVVTLEKKGGSEKLTRPFWLSGSWYQ